MQHAFDVRKRREHFKTKIEALEKLQESLQVESEAIDANRTKLTLQMKDLQSKLTEVRLESERIKNIKGEFVTSDVSKLKNYAILTHSLNIYYTGLARNIHAIQDV